MVLRMGPTLNSYRSIWTELSLIDLALIGAFLLPAGEHTRF